MYKVFAVVLSVLTLSAVAQARTPMPVYTSVLTRVEITGARNVRREGTITVNEARQTIQLRIVEGPFCPPNALCIVGPHVIVDAEMPIVQRDRDEDGVEILSAKIDRRPVDGELQQIQIRDYRFSKSFARRPGSHIAPLQARFMMALSRMAGPRVEPFLAYLEGTALQMYPFSR